MSETNRVVHPLSMKNIYINNRQKNGKITESSKKSFHEQQNQQPFVTRKKMIEKIIAMGGSAIITSSAIYKASASEEQTIVMKKQTTNKPFAPTEALLPATRLKLWTDQAFDISNTLTSTETKENQYKVMQDLNQILSSPPKLFLSDTKKSKKNMASMAQITSSASNANKKQYKQNRQEYSSIGDKFAAMLNQADVERQWGMLQYEESKREESNEMRMAFNYYTQQINFADTYSLTASKEQRKKMIRNDELPTLTAVIASDLDLRDLYRNQYLTAMEDVIAEVAYQIKQTPDMIDYNDTNDLMKQAYTAISQWFDLISPDDVQDALSIIQIQSQTEANL